jgi:hypothetical protein
LANLTLEPRIQPSHGSDAYLARGGAVLGGAVGIAGRAHVRVRELAGAPLIVVALAVGVRVGNEPGVDAKVLDAGGAANGSCTARMNREPSHSGTVAKRKD